MLFMSTASAFSCGLRCVFFKSLHIANLRFWCVAATAGGKIKRWRQSSALEEFSVSLCHKMNTSEFYHKQSEFLREIVRKGSMVYENTDNVVKSDSFSAAPQNWVNAPPPLVRCCFRRSRIIALVILLSIEASNSESSIGTFLIEKVIGRKGKPLPHAARRSSRGSPFRRTLLYCLIFHSFHFHHRSIQQFCSGACT